MKHTDKVDRFISLRGAIFYLGKLGRIDSELNLELRQLVEDLRRPMVEAKSKRGRDAALAGVKKRKLADEIDMTAPQMKKACAKRQNAEKVASEDVHRTEVKDEREDERGHDIKVGALRRPKSTKNQEKSSSDSESESEDDNIKSYILGSGTRCEKHFNSYSDSSEDEHSVSAHNQESKSAPVPPKTGYQQDFVLSDQSQSESESESQNEASDSDSDSGSD